MNELDPEIVAMLRREASRVEIPADAASRVTDRLAASLGPASGGGGGQGGGGQGGAATGAAGATPTALATKLLPFALTFAVGAGFGGTIVAMTMPRAHEQASSAGSERSPVASGASMLTTSAVPLPSSGSAPSPGAVPSLGSALPAPSSSLASVSVDALPSAALTPPATSALTALTGGAALPRPAATADAAVAGADLVAERQVLDAARAALGRGDHAEAKRGLDEHESKYPSGGLVEEREALRVRTLADSGRPIEARAAAARFRARFPASVLLPAVDSSAAGP